ncbi:hypothetical protein [Georgenia deserti]|uniref:Uncharacterized protein n=1 Tax=Georgenia deserti TaxID=2093781 RepID=A0ABW4L998_9MICO
MHEQDDAVITDRRAEMAAERALVEAEREFWDRMARAGLDEDTAEADPVLRSTARDAG